MFEKVKGQCDRCHLPHNNRTTMSIFNTDTICIPCKKAEQNHPMYPLASDKEMEQVKQGNFNFEGIGLPADLQVSRVV